MTIKQYNAVHAYALTIDGLISAGEVHVLANLLFGPHVDWNLCTDIRKFTAAERAYLDLLHARGLVTITARHRPQALDWVAVTPADAVIDALPNHLHGLLLRRFNNGLTA